MATVREKRLGRFAAAAAMTLAFGAVTVPVSASNSTTYVVTSARGGGAQTPARSSDRAFIRLSVPKKRLYVGESVPITIHAYYHAGTAVTLTGTPKPSTPDFTLSLGDAAQGQTNIDGEPYLVVTWKGHISPVKAGSYALSISVPSTLEWQSLVEPPASNEPDQDPFEGMLGNGFGDFDSSGDPFAWARQQMQRMQRMMKQEMQNFGGPVSKRDVVLDSNAQSVEVVPLPSTGRPESFSGAVGEFQLSASADHTQVRAGEPVELTITVRGDGNLDRVNVSGVAASPELEVYPPSANQKDGEKTFGQAVVPRRPGKQDIPAVTFSYFDPNKKAYVTAKAPSIPLDVAPGQTAVATSSGRLPDATTGPVLAPNADEIGKTTRTLRPLYLRSSFWFAQLAPLLLFGGAASGIVLRRRFGSDPRRRALGVRRALRHYQSEMDRAVATHDAARFFAAARAGLQEKLGYRFGVVPSALTLVELEQRLGGEQLETLRRVFDADAARFGVGAAGDDLGHWRDLVQRELARKEAA